MFSLGDIKVCVCLCFTLCFHVGACVHVSAAAGNRKLNPAINYLAAGKKQGSKDTSQGQLLLLHFLRPSFAPASLFVSFSCFLIARLPSFISAFSTHPISVLSLPSFLLLWESYLLFISFFIFNFSLLSFLLLPHFLVHP